MSCELGVKCQELGVIALRPPSYSYGGSMAISQAWQSTKELRIKN